MLQFLPALILLLLSNPQNLERFESEFGVSGRNLHVRDLDAVTPLLAAWLASGATEEEAPAYQPVIETVEAVCAVEPANAPEPSEGFSRFQRDRAGPA